MEVKKSKIVSLVANGAWNELNKFDTVMENGDKGTLYTVDAVHPCKVGDEVHYTRKENGTMSIVDPNDLPIPDSVKQLMIVRQSSIKSSVECHNNVANSSSETVIEVAEVFTNYVLNGKQ